MTGANRKHQGGLGFHLWTNRGAWFWRLSGRRCGISTVGSASTESEALNDAEAVVDELAARCVQTAPGRSNQIGGRDLGWSTTDAEDRAGKAGK